ncbi:MAG: SDR family NAD(P)-dependent oxidoreductase, partial [Methanobrevibacter sp.]|nr:SDR family NAD(P)-dependent oxidoreductase [Methanobrevibacter sp.]
MDYRSKFCCRRWKNFSLLKQKSFSRESTFKFRLVGVILLKNYILITGASSGIGRETAITLSKSYSLILNGRNIERLNETKNLCSNSNENIL